MLDKYFLKLYNLQKTGTAMGKMYHIHLFRSLQLNMHYMLKRFRPNRERPVLHLFCKSAKFLPALSSKKEIKKRIYFYIVFSFIFETSLLSYRTLHQVLSYPTHLS